MEQSYCDSTVFAMSLTMCHYRMKDAAQEVVEADLQNVAASSLLDQSLDQ